MDSQDECNRSEREEHHRQVSCVFSKPNESNRKWFHGTKDIFCGMAASSVWSFTTLKDHWKSGRLTREFTMRGGFIYWCGIVSELQHKTI
ncbi:hypothetical protein AVEN_81641-1 [Araneus ventricosus]|uniref:Uncharacterized protein n=1 Tax=Araneus ventricosus TaxID=182803 RepID=A0A4Y2H1Z2_ARAVE|nr:hypothetical protein AVEN_81641-1 [Araneus ventricosus]